MFSKFNTNHFNIITGMLTAYHPLFVTCYMLSWNILECPIGYYLNNCSKVCSPPNYGEDCQSICQCPYTDCHFATGCLHHVETVTGVQRLSIIFIHKLCTISYIWMLYKQLLHGCIYKWKLCKLRMNQKYFGLQYLLILKDYAKWFENGKFWIYTR